MNDERVWNFETSLWVKGPENYREKVDQAVLMVLPTPPHVFAGTDAIEAVAATPVWDSAELTERHVSRPEENHIVVAYKVTASRDGETYTAWCTSAYRRIEPEVWSVIQHQQTPPLAMGAAETKQG